MTEHANDADLERALASLASNSEDEQAWRLLFGILWPFVLALVWRRVRDPSIAEDAAQEVFVRLARAKPFKNIDGASQMRAYIWRVAVNVASDWILDRKRQQMRRDAVRDLNPPNVTPEPAQSEDRILFGEVFALARRNLMKDETELLAHLLRGHSVGETARATGQSYSATAVRLHRLRGKLHKLLFSQ
jgi:RNA polymerase sigma factor (sigma-70 family)